jgi:predicted transcriptional regulator YdeE
VASVSRESNSIRKARYRNALTSKELFIILRIDFPLLGTDNLMPINLTGPDTVAWPGSHYVFLEKVGSFQKNAPQAWQELNKLSPAIAEHNQITGYFSLYKVETQIYRAGVSVASEPEQLPEGVAYEKVGAGNYARFTLVGSYRDLPEASGRAFEIASRERLPLRDGHNIENYVSDPKTTPEDQLITEILFPIEP